MQHPYLYFSRADILAFREKIKNDPEAKKRYDAAVASAEDCLKEAPMSWDECNGNSGNQHANFGGLRGQCERLANVLGTKYLVEGDERCAERLKAQLLTVTGYERWFGVAYTVRKPVPWHSDLCSTGTTMACCNIYDIIHDYLTPAEQDDIAMRLMELGVKPALGDWCLPENRIHAVDSMGHNWWAVCIAEAATGLLALQEHLPAEWVKETFRLVNEALAAYFTYPGNVLYNKLRNYTDGLFYESIGYFEYGTGTPLRYLVAYERYFGLNKVLRDALPQNMGDALMNLSYPYTTKEGKVSYCFPNYGDAGLWDTRSFLTGYLIRAGLGTGAARCARSKQGISLWEEIAGVNFDAPDASVEYLPLTKFYGSGYMITRESWQPDANMLTIKSGYCWNHSHNDSGTFAVFHKGRPLIPDNGCCDYDDPKYHAYYCQDWAHNVIRVGGKGRRDEELYRGTKFPGTLNDHYETEDCVFVQADCTGPMAHLCSRLYRNFFWINNRILAIFDDVFTHVEDTIDFSMHYVGTLTQKDGGYNIDDGDSHARLLSHLPVGMVYNSRIGYADHEPNKEEPYLELSTTQKERTNLLIHTLELEPQDNVVTYTKLEGAGSDGIRIEDGNKSYELWFNHMADGHVMHDNANNIVGGFDTDAYILLITRDKVQGSEKVLAVCSSYLRRDGKVYQSAFIKETKEVVTNI